MDEVDVDGAEEEEAGCPVAVVVLPSMLGWEDAPGVGVGSAGTRWVGAAHIDQVRDGE